MKDPRDMSDEELIVQPDEIGTWEEVIKDAEREERQQRKASEPESKERNENG